MLMKIRLDKFISVNTDYSRSDIRIAARRGKIIVNGEVVRACDAKIDPDSDVITIHGDVVKNYNSVYLVMNKPAGVISASNDKKAKTVIDLVPEEFRHFELFPVGRLDRDTTGLLIITNDGDFAHRVISPKNDIEKCYSVELDGEISIAMKSEFKKGIILADGTRCKPAKLKITGSNTALVTITEGKYHQIKRMFGVLGLGVNKLHRISVGELCLKDSQKSGECVLMDYAEISEKVFKT